MERRMRRKQMRARNKIARGDGARHVGLLNFRDHSFSEHHAPGAPQVFMEIKNQFAPAHHVPVRLERQKPLVNQDPSGVVNSAVGEKKVDVAHGPDKRFPVNCFT